MFGSITNPPANYSEDEQVPRSGPPWVWVGFLFVGAFLTLEVAFVILQLDEEAINAILTLIAIVGWIYWLVCIHRIHKILAELTQNRYPNTPGEAALKHIIPFYNLVWIFRWPSDLADYINQRGRVKMVAGGVIGAIILVALLLRFFDGAIGLALLFGVTMYVSAKVKKHVQGVGGVPADQLPPLPDPKIFSQPLESSHTTNAADGSEPVKSL